MSSKLLLLLVSIASISICRGQNVLINGDFDTPPPDGSLAPWDFTTNVAAVTNQGFNSGPAAAALSVGGDHTGDMLSQSFATTIGQTYALDFEAGVYGEPSAGPLSLQIQVTGATTQTLDTIEPPNNNDFGPAPFLPFHYTFMADSASTTLKFTEIGGGNASADVMVDTVSVSAVPEPATFELMVMGSGLLGLIVRRRYS